MIAHETLAERVDAVAEKTPSLAVRIVVGGPRPGGVSRAARGDDAGGAPAPVETSRADHPIHTYTSSSLSGSGSTNSAPASRSRPGTSSGPPRRAPASPAPSGRESAPP
ncbi:hypothetical protein AB1398_05120, partial [Hydrogenibacillus schlegelii]